MQPKNWPVHAPSYALAFILSDSTPLLGIYSVDRLCDLVAFFIYNKREGHELCVLKGNKAGTLKLFKVARQWHYLLKPSVSSEGGFP